jgi:branched-chain amino acid aminotransferase
MVTTFAVDGGRLEVLAAADTMAAASAGLPMGAYTTLRTYGGRRVVRLEAHRRRLEESAGGAPLDGGALREALRAALAATGHPESRLRVTFAPPRLFVSVEPFAPPPEDLYASGARAVTVPGRREDPHAKDTRFLAAAQAAYAALPEGVHEGLLLGEDGAILEGLSSNFFAVRDGVLRTEDRLALHGVTRTMVLELARPLLPQGPGALRVDELPGASEAFVTSVSREVLPVVQVDAVPLGDGRPGPVARALLRLYRDEVLREAEALA